MWLVHKPQTSLVLLDPPTHSLRLPNDKIFSFWQLDRYLVRWTSTCSLLRPVDWIITFKKRRQYSILLETGSQTARIVIVWCCCNRCWLNIAYYCHVSCCSAHWRHNCAAPPPRRSKPAERPAPFPPVTVPRLLWHSARRAHVLSLIMTYDWQSRANALDSVSGIFLTPRSSPSQSPHPLPLFDVPCGLCLAGVCQPWQLPRASQKSTVPGCAAKKALLYRRHVSINDIFSNILSIIWKHNQLTQSCDKRLFNTRQESGWEVSVCRYGNELEV